MNNIQKDEIIVHIQESNCSKNSIYESILGAIVGGGLVLISNYILMTNQLALENKKIIIEKEKLMYKINHQKKIDIFTEFSYGIDHSFNILHTNTPDEIYKELISSFLQLISKKEYKEANKIFYKIKISTKYYIMNLEQKTIILQKTAEILHKYQYNLLPYISKKKDRELLKKKYNLLTSYFNKNINNINLINEEITTLINTYQPNNPNSISQYYNYIDVNKNKIIDAYLSVKDGNEDKIRNLNEIKTFIYNVLFENLTSTLGLKQ